MRSGGKYRKAKNGKTQQIEPSTQDHAQGNCARDEKGQALAPSIRKREAQPAQKQAQKKTQKTGGDK